jgi:hypothetical protein
MKKVDGKKSMEKVDGKKSMEKSRWKKSMEKVDGKSRWKKSMEKRLCPESVLMQHTCAASTIFWQKPHFFSCFCCHDFYPRKYCFSQRQWALLVFHKMTKEIGVIKCYVNNARLSVFILKANPHQTGQLPAIWPPNSSGYPKQFKTCFTCLWENGSFLNWQQ